MATSVQHSNPNRTSSTQSADSPAWLTLAKKCGAIALSVLLTVAGVVSFPLNPAVGIGLLGLALLCKIELDQLISPQPSNRQPSSSSTSSFRWFPPVFGKDPRKRRNREAPPTPNRHVKVGGRPYYPHPHSQEISMSQPSSSLPSVGRPPRPPTLPLTEPTIGVESGHLSNIPLRSGHIPTTTRRTTDLASGYFGTLPSTQPTIRVESGHLPPPRTNVRPGDGHIPTTTQPTIAIESGHFPPPRTSVRLGEGHIPTTTPPTIGVESGHLPPPRTSVRPGEGHIPTTTPPTIAIESGHLPPSRTNVRPGEGHRRPGPERQRGR